MVGVAVVLVLERAFVVGGEVVAATTTRISQKWKKHAIKSVAQAQISFNKVKYWTVATVLSLS
jgi:hypothetical protein